MQGLGVEKYETKTKGTREKPAARIAGEGGTFFNFYYLFCAASPQAASGPPVPVTLRW